MVPSVRLPKKCLLIYFIPECITHFNISLSLKWLLLNLQGRLKNVPSFAMPIIVNYSTDHLCIGSRYPLFNEIVSRKVDLVFRYFRLPKFYVNTIDDMYEGTSEIMWNVWRNRETEEFRVRVMIHQDSVLNPYLFSLGMIRFLKADLNCN